MIRQSKRKQESAPKHDKTMSKGQEISLKRLSVSWDYTYFLDFILENFKNTHTVIIVSSIPLKFFFPPEAC